MQAAPTILVSRNAFPRLNRDSSEFERAIALMPFKQLDNGDVATLRRLYVRICKRLCLIVRNLIFAFLDMQETALKDVRCDKDPQMRDILVSLTLPYRDVFIEMGIKLEKFETPSLALKIFPVKKRAFPAREHIVSPLEEIDKLLLKEADFEVLQKREAVDAKKCKLMFSLTSGFIDLETDVHTLRCLPIQALFILGRRNAHKDSMDREKWMTLPLLLGYVSEHSDGGYNVTYKIEKSGDISRLSTLTYMYKIHLERPGNVQYSDELGSLDRRVKRVHMNEIWRFVKNIRTCSIEEISYHTSMRESLCREIVDKFIEQEYMEYNSEGNIVYTP